MGDTQALDFVSSSTSYNVDVGKFAYWSKWYTVFRLIFDDDDGSKHSGNGDDDNGGDKYDFGYSYKNFSYKDLGSSSYSYQLSDDYKDRIIDWANDDDGGPWEKSWRDVGFGSFINTNSELNMIAAAYDEVDFRLDYLSNSEWKSNGYTKSDTTIKGKDEDGALVELVGRDR